MKNYHELKVWEKSHLLTLETYKITKTFPKTELFGITSQIRRSCVSIPANIAEGCGRNSDAEFSRFLVISMGSASELEYLIQLAHDLTYINHIEFEELTKNIVEVKKMLTSLIQKLSPDN